MFRNLLRHILLPLLAIFIAQVIFVACGKEAKDTIDYEYDRSVIPMVATDSVTMHISDSGVVKYKILAKTWDIYEAENDPYWLFPDKFYAEQFDTLFQVIATVEADSVWYYTKKKLALLRGNVFIRNNLNETFSGEELFWDQDRHKIYSQHLVTIKRPGRMTLIAKRFEANEQMTDYDFISARAPEIYPSQSKEDEEPETEDKNEISKE